MPVFGTYSCARCGSPFASTHSQQKYCLECRPLARTENLSAYRTVHREERRAKQALYFAAHKIQSNASSARYEATHREELREYAEKYRADNPEKMRIGRAESYARHAPQVRANVAAYAKLHPEVWRLHSAKRRVLGFTPLNSWFIGCEGHHINKSDVIYLPRKLHRSIWHNQWTGQGMAEINALAGAFLTEDWT